jgi:hypothetical protein
VIAEERLSSSLGVRCVPAAIVRAMVSRGLDPFRAVEHRLEELDCDRRRLRPDDAIKSWGDEAPAFLKSAGAAAERMSPGECRKSFEKLFALDQAADEFPNLVR